MNSQLVTYSKEEQSFIIKQLSTVRGDKKDCPYLKEARSVLAVKGFRSAIGCYWNSVVDDLRQKIMHRSLELFNKEFKSIGGKREIKIYEDFPEHVTDHDLIECAYKIGAINWEAKKILHQARETRNVFDGHPKSSNPELVKVLSFISDCNKYVLNEPFPAAIIDINEYLKIMDTDKYDRNPISIQQAMSDLPETYKKELIHRLYSAYINESTSTTLRSNIEFIIPILWPELAKEDRKEIGMRLDKDKQRGNRDEISHGLNFLRSVKGFMYVSKATRLSIYKPLIDSLSESLDKWKEEERIVNEIKSYGYSIPQDCIKPNVKALSLTFVGFMGGSIRYSRRDFFSDNAAPVISEMFENFDDDCVTAFVETVKNSRKLKDRIINKTKLNRLRILGNIILEKGIGREEDIKFIEFLCNDSKTDEFYHKIKA